jgi:hypothetical protein
MNLDWLALTPQSGGAGINQPIGFQLIKKNDGFDDKTIKVRAVCGDKAAIKTITLKGKTYPVGTVFNFDYTGSVQQVTLPPGRYQLQCWGAQGGSVSGSYTATGSKGGYSEGTIKLTKTTTLYIFVGGKGTDSSTGSTSGTVNGGWNGGGGSVRYSSYSSGDTDGRSYPRPGGGATDIALLSSDMSYSSYRNNRSQASLLSRFIVAGGGAGASARYTYTSSTNKVETSVGGFSSYISRTYVASGNYTDFNFGSPALTSGETYVLRGAASTPTAGIIAFYGSSYAFVNPTTEFVAKSGFTSWSVRFSGNVTTQPALYFTLYKVKTETSTSATSGESNGSQQGGGTSGRGTSPGTQNGGGGEFGKGANQTTTNYRYDSGAGGGGWYGGGSSYSDSSTSYINSSGGGSGFVNTPANASYRPSGYTGLELESGSTKDGATSFPSTSGGTETGHSGNGYCKITVL